jgi:nucleoside-diphosphate-sugar epimerase
MRILLIGGTGFIGSFLAPELQRQGAEVATLTRGRSPIPHADGLTRIIGDRKRLRDALSSIRAFEPDVVVDLVSIDVYRACGILHGLEEGPLEPVPLTEDSPLRTKLATYPPAQIAALQQIFGWLDDEYDKIPVEQAVLGQPSLPGTVLRLPMIYGPGDPLHRLWPLVKRMDDRRAAIPMDARVAAWRSPRGYAENVAAAIALAAMSDRAVNRVYNVAEPESYSELEWARRVAKIVGWTGDVIALPPDQTPPHLRLPGNFDQHWSADSTRIRNELGFKEPVVVDEAIRRTVAWERSHPPAAPMMPIDYDAEDAAIAAARMPDVSNA